MMFVSHRMDEIYRIADRVAVYARRAPGASTSVSQMPHDRAVQLMVGHPLSDMYPALDAKVGETVVKVEELTRSGIFAQLHSRLKPGRFWIRRLGREWSISINSNFSSLS